MNYILGFIVGFGLVLSVVLFRKNQKKRAFLEILVTALVPFLTAVFCLSKGEHSFEGSDLEFIYNSAFVDKQLEAIVLVFLAIFTIGFGVYNIATVNTKKKYKKKK